MTIDRAVRDARGKQDQGTQHVEHTFIEVSLDLHPHACIGSRSSLVPVGFDNLHRCSRAAVVEYLVLGETQETIAAAKVQGLIVDDLPGDWSR